MSISNFETKGESRRTQVELRMAYETALVSGLWCGHLDISPLVTKSGSTQRAFVDPSNKPVPLGSGLGLGREPKSPRCIQIKSLDAEVLRMTLQAERPDCSLVEAHIFFLKTPEGTWELLDETRWQQRELHVAYSQAEREGVWEGGLDLSRLVHPTGRLSSSFPDPGGREIGRGKFTGLGRVSDPLCARVTRVRDHEVAVEFQATGTDGMTLANTVFFTLGSSSEWELLHADIKTQRDLAQAYNTARDIGVWTGSVDLSTVVAPDGTTREFFPDPDGGLVGRGRGVGLQSQILFPRCVEILHPSPTSFITRIVADTSSGKSVSSTVRFERFESSTWTMMSEREYARHQLIEAYRCAKENGTWQGSIDLTTLISPNGLLKISFPYPFGEPGRRRITSGLPRDSREPRCISVTATRDGAFTLNLIARTSQGTEITHTLTSTPAAPLQHLRWNHYEP